MGRLKNKLDGQSTPLNNVKWVLLSIQYISRPQTTRQTNVYSGNTRYKSLCWNNAWIYIKVLWVDTTVDFDNPKQRADKLLGKCGGPISGRVNVSTDNPTRTNGLVDFLDSSLWTMVRAGDRGFLCYNYIDRPWRQWSFADTTAAYIEPVSSLLLCWVSSSLPLGLLFDFAEPKSPKYQHSQSPLTRLCTVGSHRWLPSMKNIGIY